MFITMVIIVMCRKLVYGTFSMWFGLRLKLLMLFFYTCNRDLQVSLL